MDILVTSYLKKSHDTITSYFFVKVTSYITSYSKK